MLTNDNKQQQATQHNTSTHIATWKTNKNKKQYTIHTGCSNDSDADVYSCINRINDNISIKWMLWWQQPLVQTDEQRKYKRNETESRKVDNRSSIYNMTWQRACTPTPNYKLPSTRIQQSTRSWRNTKYQPYLHDESDRWRENIKENTNWWI